MFFLFLFFASLHAWNIQTGNVSKSQNNNNKRRHMQPQKKWFQYMRSVGFVSVCVTEFQLMFYWCIFISVTHPANEYLYVCWCRLFVSLQFVSFVTTLRIARTWTLSALTTNLYRNSCFVLPSVMFGKPGGERRKAVRMCEWNVSLVNTKTLPVA